MITAGLLARGDLGLLVVGRVVVRRLRRELGGAGVDRLVDRADAERVPDLADDVLAHPADLADLGRRSRAAWPRRSSGVELVGGGQLVRDLLDQASWSTNHGSIFVASKTSSWVAPARSACMTVLIRPSVGRDGLSSSASGLSPGSPTQ
jgi:hypothetical protein